MPKCRCYMLLIALLLSVVTGCNDKGTNDDMNRTGLAGGSRKWEIGVMAERIRYSPEVRERAVRMVTDHREQYSSQWSAIQSIASKIGCSSETLRKWVVESERDQGQRPGLTTEERARLKQLERENRELRRANEILRKASAYFAQAELDRRPQ